jgi:hypothetical protein
MSDKQTDFFSIAHTNGPELAKFAELCNALYERELHTLAHANLQHPSLIKRKLAGLPYHIKNVAYFLCDHNAPLDVDAHNASFQHKQAQKAPSLKLDNEKNRLWFHTHAKLGLVVPVHVEELDNHHIELDCVDKVDLSNHCIHTNKHGWFHFNDDLCNTLTSEATTTLVKPTKAIMQAACCGHTWNYKSRTLPRALTLREMRLSAQIDWKKFTVAKIKIFHQLD